MLREFNMALNKDWKYYTELFFIQDKINEIVEHSNNMFEQNTALLWEVKTLRAEVEKLKTKKR